MLWPVLLILSQSNILFFLSSCFHRFDVAVACWSFRRMWEKKTLFNWPIWGVYIETTVTWHCSGGVVEVLSASLLFIKKKKWTCSEQIPTAPIIATEGLAADYASSAPSLLPHSGVCVSAVDLKKKNPSPLCTVGPPFSSSSSSAAADEIFVRPRLTLR